MLKKSKIIIFLSTLALTSAAVLSFSTSSALTPFDISSEKYRIAQEIKTSLDTKLLVENNTIKKSEGVNPVENGTKAVVMSKANDKLVIVDNKGNILDDLNDLHTKMEKLKLEKDEETERHIGNVVGAGHLLGNKMYYSSNYTSSDWKNSIWSFDLSSRIAKKILSNENYDNISFLSTTKNNLLFKSDKDLGTEQLVIELIEDESIIEHLVPGHVINASPDGMNIVYRIFKDEGILDNKIGIYNVKTKKYHEISGIPDKYLFNNYVTWNDSGTKFAFLSISIEDEQEKHKLLVYDLISDNLIQISEPIDNSFQAGEDNIEFENDNIINMPTTKNTFVSITLY